MNCKILELLRRAAITIDPGRRQEILQKISDQIPAGGKFKVVSPNSPRILKGDVIVAVQEGIPSRDRGGLVLRPLIKNLTQADLRAEISRLHCAFRESYAVDFSSTNGIVPGDVTFQVHAVGKQYPADFFAVWRSK